MSAVVPGSRTGARQARQRLALSRSGVKRPDRVRQNCNLDCEAVSLRTASSQEITTRYDAEALQSYFAKRPWSVVGRLIQVTQQFVSLFISLKLSPSQRGLSDELCSFLSSLGPTFVKLGQTLSTREDLVGKEIARALADLQMAAPPFSDSIAYEVITHELGGSPASKYKSLSETHVAAASLGQVYKGTVGTGESVAVKVQRPDVLNGIALDVFVLRLGLGLVRRIAGINSDIRNIADEVGKGLFAELDYTVEAAQAELFATAHSHLPYIDAVTILPELSSEKVLTTIWVDGDSPNSLMLRCEQQPEGSEERARIRARLVHMVNLGIECSLSQLLETGVMHADPHPGNLILTPDDRLVYLDFGLLTYVPAQSCQAMMGCLVHVALGEWRRMADDLDAMGFLKDKIDKDELAVALEEEVVKVWPLAGSFGTGSFLIDGTAQAGGTLASRIQDGSVRPELGLGQGLTFGKLAKAIIKLAIRFRFRLPPYYTLIVRSLCSLEGVALRIDPEFSIVNAAIPIILRRMLTDTRPAAVSLLRELLLDNGQQLRVGMLEGLLKNYSVEAGKGSASESPASGVVLQLEGDSVKAPGTNGVSKNAVAAGSNGTSVQSQASSRMVHVHIAEDADMHNGKSKSNSNGTYSGASQNGATGTSAREEAVRGNGVVQARSRLKARGSEGTTAVLLPSVQSIDEEYQVMERSSSVGVATRNGADEHMHTSDVKDSRGNRASEATKVDQQPETESLEATVLKMVLSARAAGVRRVILESDMKAIAESTMGSGGKARRAAAVQALAKVVSWRMLPIAIITVLRTAVVTFLRSFRVLLLRQRTSRGLRMPARSADVMGVHLSRASVKRAQLVAIVAFSRLWQQSKMVAIRSILMSVRIALAALVASKQGPERSTVA